MRSGALTLPGYVHDICSSIHALGILSPFMKSLLWPNSACSGVTRRPPWPTRWRTAGPPSSSGPSRPRQRGWATTARPIGGCSSRWSPEEIRSCEVLGPFRPPRHPLLMMRSAGWRRDLPGAWRGAISGATWRAVCSRGWRPLDPAAGDALHGRRRPDARHLGAPRRLAGRGGSQRLAAAMAGYLRSLGGEIVVGRRVRSLADCPLSRAILFDVTPRQLCRIACDALPAGYRRKLERFRYGPGVFKLDWALDGPIPWKAPACLRSATVHVGGAPDEVAAAERAPWGGQHAERPFLSVANNRSATIRAARREADGVGLLPRAQWLHVRHDGPDRVAAGAVRAQVPRPDLRAKHHEYRRFQRHDENFIGGDITGGVMDIWQLFTPPPPAWSPTRLRRRTFSSARHRHRRAEGVHGMCGYHAAEAALRTALRD